MSIFFILIYFPCEEIFFRCRLFLRKWANRLSFSVTIDGNKELHDSCRVFPDGGPSYDIAVDAASDWMKRGNHMGSKITIAPGNISFLYDAIKHPMLNKDNLINVLGVTKDTKGDRWYKVSITKKEYVGYVSAKYIIKA